MSLGQYADGFYTEASAWPCVGFILERMTDFPDFSFCVYELMADHIIGVSA